MKVEVKTPRDEISHHCAFSEHSWVLFAKLGKEMVLVELRSVLAVAEISGGEHWLSNQRLADVWDEGHRGAKRELEKPEREVSLTLAGPRTQLWTSNASGRYGASKDQKNELLGLLNGQEGAGLERGKQRLALVVPICEEA